MCPEAPFEGEKEVYEDEEAGGFSLSVTRCRPRELWPSAERSDRDRHRDLCQSDARIERPGRGANDNCEPHGGALCYLFASAVADTDGSDHDTQQHGNAADYRDGHDPSQAPVLGLERVEF